MSPAWCPRSTAKFELLIRIREGRTRLPPHQGQTSLVKPFQGLPPGWGVVSDGDRPLARTRAAGPARPGAASRVVPRSPFVPERRGAFLISSRYFGRCMMVEQASLNSRTTGIRCLLARLLGLLLLSRSKAAIDIEPSVQRRRLLCPIRIYPDR